MSMFKKPTRKFRQRVVRTDSDDEECNDTANEKEEIPGTEQQKSEECGPRENKTTLKLSFGSDEEEGDAFKVKKSSYSRRISSRKKRLKEKEDKDQVYMKMKTEKDLNMSIRKKMELEKESLISSTKSFEFNKSKSDPVGRIFAGDDIESESEDEEPDSSSFHRFNTTPSVLEKGVIPDAKTIYELKKQRQMARDIDEYIALENEYNKDDDERSRVISDNEHEPSPNEDDETDDERINFAVDKEAVENERNKKAFMMANESEDSETKVDSDDELDRWEQEQIRRGVGFQAPISQSNFYEANTNVNFNSIPVPSQSSDYSSKTKIKPIPSHLTKTRHRFSKQDILRKISDNIKARKVKIESIEREMENVRIQQEQSEQTLGALEGEMLSLKERYESYRSRYIKKINNGHQIADRSGSGDGMESFIMD